MAVLPEHLARRVADLDDGVIVLLVGDDPGPTVDEEGVVGEVEAARRWWHGGRGVLPGDVAAGVQGQQAVVAPVGDQQGPAVRGSGTGHAGWASVRAGPQRDDRLEGAGCHPGLVR